MSADVDVVRPLDRWQVVRRLVGGAVLLILALWAVGWPLVNTSALSFLRFADAGASLRILTIRTPDLDGLSGIASSFSDTATCIAVLIVVMVAFRLWLGRWRESLVVLAAIAGELVLFLAVTGVVARDRPTIEHLDPAPPTSSFPSGHTAAAVALYGCIAVILLRRLRPAWVAIAVAALLWCVPAAVGISRMYRGMHHMSDVVVGATAGGIWLMIVLATLYALPQAPPRDPAAVPPRRTVVTHPR